MFHLDSKDLVVDTAVILSVVCFISFFAQALYAEFAKPEDHAKKKVKENASFVSDRVKSLTPPTVPELTDLLKGFATLMDSFTKAGPAITSIGASVLFLLIAAIASGAFQGAPPPAPKEPPAAHADADPKAAPDAAPETPSKLDQQGP